MAGLDALGLRGGRLPTGPKPLPIHIRALVGGQVVHRNLQVLQRRAFLHVFVRANHRLLFGAVKIPQVVFTSCRPEATPDDSANKQNGDNNEHQDPDDVHDFAPADDPDEVTK
ncbi:hypothetical protein SK803_08300 [Lentzea sp. BCCO 10_0856]|uniref:Uncharacterized protein n=1 Tax=Lentzea miocenica TaxID=3095431 RepID=A0ABU4SWC7_9PSEU|nr:hypothetical protein [Lentzea sp. BCCO 10_0856]MDX8030209.1 hypothetical protein [Lentzea sp. BCCO 10_0856]